MTKEEEKIQLLSALVLVFLVIAGYGIYSWIGGDKQNKNSDAITEAQQYAWIEKGKDSIAIRLKDPESAQFRDVFFHYNRAYSPVACGEVNSKNGFGGYVGFQRFIFAGKPEFTFLESDMKSAQEFNETWFSLCHGQDETAG